MAAAALEIGINVIGVVSGILGIVQFGQDNMPSRTSDGVDSSVRIAVGLNGHGMTNAAGNVGNIKVYDQFQVICGAGEGDGTIGDGRFQDIVIPQKYGPGKQPTYLQINGDDDGVCIAYISQTWPDGQQRGWLGDIGRLCGAQWYYSSLDVDGHSPACTWVDQNHDNNDPVAGIQMHMSDFNQNDTADYSKDPAHYCSWPTMWFSPATDHQGMPDNQIWGSATDKGAISLPASKRKRNLRARSQGLSNTIVGSQMQQHSAQELCQSKTSHGADFVSFHEQLFCDMETKMLWPLCSTSVEDSCYQWDNHTLIDQGGHVEKNYGNVHNWQ